MADLTNNVYLTPEEEALAAAQAEQYRVDNSEVLGFAGYQGAVAPEESTPATILCCMCGTPIPSNPANMCVNCIRTQVDITEGIPKQDHVQFCKDCERYLNPPNHWVTASLESKELLSLCLKRIKGLNKVKLVDANFVWTEPHSRRLKVKLTIQREVFNGTILQQAFVVEFVVNTQQCEDCQRVAAKDTWTAVVQLRQRVGHKRTILFLEQLILKHAAHQNTINIREQPDGLDFFYSHRGHAQTFLSFLQSVTPMRYKASDKLVSHDSKSNIYNYKYTYSAEIVPICRDDIMALPHKTAQSLGSISPFVLCLRVTNQVQLLDPLTLQVADLSPAVFFSNPFRTLWQAQQMIMWTVLDVTPLDPAELAQAQSGHSSHRKLVLADVEVARTSDFGVNDTVFYGRTHLGAWLKPGDYALGYDLTTANFNDQDVQSLRGRDLPEFVLVRKAYPERRKRRRNRHWTLPTLTKMADDDDTVPVKGREIEKRINPDMDEELFKQMLEEDPEMRSQVSLIATQGAAQIKAENDALPLPEEEEDFPEVELSELIAGLDISNDAGASLEQQQPEGEVPAEEVTLTVEQAQELFASTQAELAALDQREAELNALAQQHGPTDEMHEEAGLIQQQRAVLSDQLMQLDQLLASVQ